MSSITGAETRLKVYRGWGRATPPVVTSMRLGSWSQVMSVPDWRRLSPNQTWESPPTQTSRLGRQRSRRIHEPNTFCQSVRFLSPSSQLPYQRYFDTVSGGGTVVVVVVVGGLPSPAPRLWEPKPVKGTILARSVATVNPAPSPLPTHATLSSAAAIPPPFSSSKSAEATRSALRSGRWATPWRRSLIRLMMA